MDYYMSEKMCFETRRNEALWNLAFWSNPTWTDTETSPLTRAASNLWVVYQRTSVALNKPTVTQIFGDVEGVIPSSRLAKYGDFCYNTDFEDMYYTAEDISYGCQLFKINENSNVKYYNIHLINSRENKVNGSDDNCTKDSTVPEHKYRVVEKCLEILKQVLERVKRLAQECPSLDSWTDTILKLCLRFLCVASVNKKLIEVLNCDIPFITDYKQLCQAPVEKAELLSFPQPQNEEESNLDSEMLDKLWLNVTSPQVCTCWKDTEVKNMPDDAEKKDISNSSPLADYNLLRRNNPKNLIKTEENIQIPEEIESHLLGSLLKVLDESLDLSKNQSYFEENAARNNFPEAHGEWTKSLFPHRFDAISSCENNCTSPGPSDASPKDVNFGLMKKTEQCPPENLTVPYKFYMNIPPPPTISSAVCMPTRPQFLRCPPRNGMLQVPNNGIPNSVVHHMNFSAPTLQTTRIRMPFYVPTATPSVRLNPNIHQRVMNPLQMQSIPRECYPRISLPRMAYHQYVSKNIIANQIRQVKTDGSHSTYENVLQQSEVIQILKEDKFERGNISVDGHWITNNSYAQQNHEGQLLFKSHLNSQSISTKCNIPHHKIYENQIRQVTSNIPIPQSNVELQAYKFEVPTKMNYPLVGSRLPLPIIQNTIHLKNNPMLTQPNFRPRLLGNLIVNNLRRIQESFLSQNYNNCKDMYGPFYQSTGKNTIVEKLALYNKEFKLDYEEKVEKWLRAVGKYSKLDPYACLEEELIESPYLKIPYDHYKLHAKKKSSCILSEQWNGKKSPQKAHSSITSEMKNIFSIFDTNKDYFRSKGRTLKKYKKKRVKNILMKHLHVFPYYVIKLKKCKDIDKGITLIKSYFAEINSKDNNKYYVTYPNKFLNMKKFSSERRDDMSRKQKTSLQNKIKFNRNKFPTIGGIDLEKSNLLINDTFDYKVLTRESCQFNSFPSKRMKTSNSSAFLLDRTCVQDEKTRKISFLRHYASLIDEIFFSNGLFEEAGGNKGKTKNDEVVNSWGHFQFALITVLENVISSIDPKSSVTI